MKKALPVAEFWRVVDKTTGALDFGGRKTLEELTGHFAITRTQYADKKVVVLTDDKAVKFYVVPEGDELVALL